ncbi:MAG: site-2 protease family protein [Planctomycetota bacterium]|jgi:Zn-dependent protease
MNPLFLATLICWILSVGVHEFAHALAAYLGGDKSAQTREYLKFNLFSYVDPVTTLLLPALFLAMGGIPLPGGAVRLNTAVLTRKWQSIVSAAGPASNLLLFFIIAIVLNPSLGLVDLSQPDQPTWVRLLCAMCVLEIFSVIINLIPIPPLDGFGIIAPWLPPELQQQARSMGLIGIFVLFFVIFRSQAVVQPMFDFMHRAIDMMGLPVPTVWDNFRLALEWN